MKTSRIAGVLASAGALAVFVTAPAEARVKLACGSRRFRTRGTSRPAAGSDHRGEDRSAEQSSGVVTRFTRRRPSRCPVRRDSSDTGSPSSSTDRARVGDRCKIPSRPWTACARTRARCTSTASDSASFQQHLRTRFSGKDGDVKFGDDRASRLRLAETRRSLALPRPLAVDGGLDPRRHVRDALDLGRNEPCPTASSRSWSSRSANFMAINGRAFVGNTPVFKARVGERIQWDVIAMGSEHHTFHVHGHRWRERPASPRDAQDGRPGGELPLPLARAASRRVALPLPRRGPHDARHDRHLPREAMRALTAAAVVLGGAPPRIRRVRPGPGGRPVPGVRAERVSTCCPGETVEWSNISSRLHTVTADDDSFDSGDIEAGDRFELTFDTVGSHGTTAACTWGWSARWTSGA